MYDNKTLIKDISELLRRYQEENELKVDYVSFKREITDTKDVWRVKTIFETKQQ